jgi:catechol 2,3-dioxygenase-like lactoylglutathione lyase family enzyme
VRCGARIPVLWTARRYGASGVDTSSAIVLIRCREGKNMKPRVTVITIGVDDLERSLRFYRDGLAFPTEGIFGTEFEYGAVAFFDLQAGLKLAIWPRKSISRDSGIPAAPPSPTELTLGHNVSSKEEVDAVMEQARNAGAVIVKEAQETFWGGYAGYFEDPDRHLWEIVWNPQMDIQE